MNVTTETRRSFTAAVRNVLTTDAQTWPHPVIYAEEINGEMRFDSANAPAVPSDAIVWLNVEADSFGDLSGDADEDASGIENNVFEQAAQDVLDALAEA